MPCVLYFIAAVVIFSNLHSNEAVNNTLQTFSAYGSAIKPPIGLAFETGKPRRLIEEICPNTWPQAKLHSWFLYNHENYSYLHACSDDFLLLSSANDSRSPYENFYHLSWCTKNDYPALINGREIVAINESTLSGRFYVAYKDDGEMETKVQFHNLTDETNLDGDSHHVLFFNVTQLRFVQRKLESKQLEKALIASYYNYVDYVDEYGRSIYSGKLLAKYMAVFCKHEDVGPLCAAQFEEYNQFQNYSVCTACKPGLFGRNCQFDADECRDMLLEEKRRYWYTRCADLDGLDAELKLDSITIYHGGHNCSENSTCINTFGSYYCHCYEGWKGKLCDEDVNECASNPCNFREACRNTLGSFLCNCPIGYSGIPCSDVDECTSNPCKFGGTCYNTLGSYFCVCLIGFSGIHCTDIEPCLSNPCKNGASCMDNKNGSYVCACAANYTGMQCEFTIEYEQEEEEEQKKAKVKIGALSGGIVAVCLFLLICLFCLQRKRGMESVTEKTASRSIGKWKESKALSKTISQATASKQATSESKNKPAVRVPSEREGMEKKSRRGHDYIVPDMC